MTLFTRYRPPAANTQGIPIVGDDEPDIGSDVGYGQNNDDSSDDFSTGWYGPPAAQSPPQPPSPSAQLTGGAPSMGSTPPSPPPQLADSAPPSPITPQRSPYSPAPIVSQDVQNAIDDRAKMQRPTLPKPSIWRQLAATLGEVGVSALAGKGKQGQQLGQELSQNIRYGPAAIRNQQQYDQRVTDADTQLTAIGKGEDILTKGDERLTNADTRKTNAAIREAQQKSTQQAAINSSMDRQITAAQKAAELGGVRVAADAMQTPNTTRVIDPMDFDPTTGQLRNKTAIDVPVKLGPIAVTDLEAAKELRVPVGTMVDPKLYFDTVGKLIEATHKAIPEGEMPIKNAGQMNKILEARFQVLHPDVPLPDQFTLQPNATQKDYDRIDKGLAGVETATGTSEQQKQTNELRKQTLALSQNKFDTSQLSNATKPIAAQMNKEFSTVNTQLQNIEQARAELQSNPVGQSLAAIKTLSALAGGQGSGVRITQAELNSIAGGLGIGEGFNNWLSRVSGQGRFDTATSKQINDVLTAVENKAREKQTTLDTALVNLERAKTVDEAHGIADQYRKSVMGSGSGPVKVSTKAERDALPSGTQYVGPDGHVSVKQ